MKKICYIATNNFAIENFLKNLIQKVSEHYKVIIICSGASKFKKYLRKKYSSLRCKYRKKNKFD